MLVCEATDVIKTIHDESSNRSALSSVVGYFYQFDLTLLHLLIDGTDEDAFGESHGGRSDFFVEVIEDYTKIYRIDQQEYVRIAQIKHHAGNAGASKYYEAVLWLYYNFLKISTNSAAKFDYKMAIFHFDTSPADSKNIKGTLDAAMAYYAKLDLERQPKVFVKLQELNLDDATKRDVFNGRCSYVKSLEARALRKKLDEKLSERFGLSSSASELYARAFGVIKDKLESEETVTVASLEESMCSDSSPKPEHFVYCIKREIYYAIERYIKSVYFQERENEAVCEQYVSICKQIETFVCAKFDDPQCRVAYVTTLISSELEDYDVATQQELDTFMRHSQAIIGFISKLAKIMYASELQSGRPVNLEEWFDVNGDQWILRHPFEMRDNGVIIASPGEGIPVEESLYTLAKRFNAHNFKPSVWYWYSGPEIRASEARRYNQSVTKIGVPDRVSVLEPTDYYYIQCLDCLEHTRYCSLADVSNIFKRGCQKQYDG